MNNKNNKTHYRQGDVLVERIDSFPNKLKPVAREAGRVILAHGEATGHAHAISDKHASLFRTDEHPGVTFLEISQAMAQLVHDEHTTIALAPGNYRVTRQREYSPEAIRNVQD